MPEHRTWVERDTLDIDVATIRRWVKQGLLHARGTLVDPDEVARLVATLAGQSSRDVEVLGPQDMTDVTCIDLFAGAGGTSLGFARAGIRHVLLNEVNSHAVATLRANSQTHNLNWEVNGHDVRDIDFSGLRSRIIQAGFPCQAFSHIGQGLGFLDTRGTMFFEFARAISEVRPDIAIGENVRGLLSHDQGRTLSTMLDAFDDLGYDVNYRLLRSQFLDVPQKRERLFIIAVRRGSGLPIVFPREKSYILTLRSALAGVPSSAGQQYSPARARVLDLVPEGGNWRDLPHDIQRDFLGASLRTSGGNTGTAKRLAWNEPSLTLTCTPSQKKTERCHPDQTRPLTVREYARIQTFPDTWEFCGGVGAQYTQIGNAVPVNMAYHVGRAALVSLGYIPLDDGYEVVDPLNRH